MRLSILVFTAVAVELVPKGSEAGSIRDPVSLSTSIRRSKRTIVVHRGEGDKCAVVSGK